MKLINLIARNHRETLPAKNNYGIGELGKMPPLYDWVQHISGHGKNFHMFLGGADDGIALRLLWNGGYEPTTLKAWSWFAQRGGLIVDVGAHTGVYTLAAFSQDSAATVISFEPHFMNFSRLNLNLRGNKFPTNGSFMLGVGERNEIMPFSISTNLDYLSSGGSIGVRPNGFTTNIQVVSLDLFFDETTQNKIKLIKIDVEGYEGACLRGMKSIISKSRPVIVFECIDVLSGV